MMDKIFRNLRENLSGGIDADYYPSGLNEDGEPIGEPLPYTLEPEECDAIDPADVTPANAEDKSAQAREAKRQQLKSEVDHTLATLTHTFADGRVVQVRKQDLPNFQSAIALGETEDWIMADNSVSSLTVEQLQEAYLSGISQGKAALRAYVVEVAEL
jgi:hypothetical protein